MYYKTVKQFNVLCGLILLLAISCHYDNKQNTSRIDKRNFSISDTLSIDKIIIENRSLKKIKLQRKNNKWSLNDSLIARQGQINLLLKTIKEMRIKQPVARSALKNVTKRMGIQNTKVDFFKKNKIIKTIYIGGETADQLGTFMMIHGAKEPYVVHIPGFKGYLSSRFSCQERDWKDKKLFHKSIKSINYNIPSTQTYRSININTKQTQALQKIYCEDFITQTPNLDEIKQREPFMVITINTTNDNQQKLNCVRKLPVNKIKYQDHKYDRERFYGIINNNIMLIQYKQFEEFIKLNNITKEFTPWQNNNQKTLQAIS